MKRLLKSKCGMTLMEILVALSLLMIIIVGTTPIMLQAYNGLYTAGEYTQNVYNAKTEVEDQLATRSSIINYSGFQVNFENLGEVASVNAKRAVSSLKNSLEALFTNARVRIYIASGSEVDDNQEYHSIVLQTVNLAFKTDNIRFDGGVEAGNLLSPEESGKKIDISAYLPIKSSAANTAASVYSDARKAKVSLVNDSTNPAAGRIGIRISSDKYPIDFTTSPIKIVVTYLDENHKPKKVHTYLTIKTPTIMIAGETNGNVQYYTTAGVVETLDNDGNVINRTLDLEGRRMNIGYDTKTGDRSDSLGAASTQVVPSNTVFKSINWITEYARTTGGSGAGSENVQYANTIYEPEYYVLTGTNGAIYRTYSFTDPGDITGKVNLDTTDNDILGINGLLLNNFTKKTQNGKDVMGIQDTEIYLDDRASTVVYPAVWGGDFSHIYGYSTYGTSVGYKGTDNWYTQSGTDTGVGQAGFYSNIANYGYYYNGYGMTFSAYTQNSKKISYILTERENALRVGGLMKDPGNYDYGHNRIWERYYWQKTDGSWTSENFETKNAKDQMDTWYYHTKINGGTTKENHARSAITELKEEGLNYTDSGVSLNQLPTYFCDIGSDGDLYRRGDQGFAQIRIKALTTLSPRFILERWVHSGEKDGIDTQLSSVKFVYNKDSNKSKITVTDAVYIPSATAGTQGSVFYVGTVAAYGLIHQTDNAHSGANDAARIWNNGSDNTGYVSTYWLMSSDDGTETTAYKYMAPVKGTGQYVDGKYDHTYNRNLMNETDVFPMLTEGENTLLPGVSPYKVKITGAKLNTDDSREFFITRSGDANAAGVKYALFTDLYFTMGFASNREMVYSKIVYGKVNNVLEEAFKYCEPLYYLSHYNDENHFANGYFNQTQYTKIAYDKKSRDNGNSSTNATSQYFNSPDNDYYNVWFPGEMYNLTKVATKDNVTVAVGYAVSGSTYTYINPAVSSNSSTALSGIHNDGVISGMVLGQDSAFKSLLYFKDATNFDKTSLSNGDVSYYTGDSEYDKLWGKDGTNIGSNSRDSVQFTCVDISVVESGDTSYYYAYYADNKGRVFRSLVATRGKDDAAATMVNYISDKSSSPGIEKVSYMEEQNIVVGDTTEKIGKYFESIKSIETYDDLIVITGHSKGTGNVNVAVGVIDKANPTNAPTWKILRWAWANYVIHDTLIQDGYIYCVGENINSGYESGCVYATTLDMLRVKPHNSELTYGAGKDVLFYENLWTANKLSFYAIAGKGE